MAVSEGTKGVKRASQLINGALLIAQQGKTAGAAAAAAASNAVGTTTSGSDYVLGPATTVRAGTAITPTVSGRVLINFSVHAVDVTPGDSVTCTLSIDGTPVLVETFDADAAGNVIFSGSVFTSGTLSGLAKLVLNASHPIRATLVSAGVHNLTIAATHAFISAVELGG